MSLRSKYLLGFVSLLIAGPLMAQATSDATAAGAASGQATAPAQAASATAGTRVHGTITDPDNELIPGATIVLTPAKGAPKKVTSGSDGTYAVTVPPGTYSVTVSMKGFSTYTIQNQKIPAAASTTLDAKLKIGEETEVVNVDDTASQLSVDPDNNASSTLITGAALDALSDDPDDLQAELTALAGPAAGPNGAQFYIDGFTGGQLPPKQSIREIRINQNPFSAQYDKPGFGRVEIFTKPGTDQYHGNFQANGNDNALNTGSPIIQSGVSQPPYHTILLNGQISGPVSKTSSFTFGGQFRSIHNNTIIDPDELWTYTANPGVACPPGTITGCELLSFPGYVAAVGAPQTRYDLSPRIDLALGKKNTMTARFRFEHATLDNQGIGGTALADNAYTGTQSETDVQISDTETVNDKIINEIHFEWQRASTGDTPLNNTPQLSVSGGFVTGGDASIGNTKDVQNHFEYQDYTSIALKHNFIRFGGRLRQTNDTNTTNAAANGEFSYTSTQFINGTYTSNQNIQIQNYAQGLASSYTYTLYNQPTVQVTSLDAGLYAEDDWKPKSNITFSYGFRFETQNFIHDKDDWAPRVALAYGVGKKKSGGPLFVLRAGYGLFYDRLTLASQENTVQQDGVKQIPLTLATSTTGNTTASISTSCTPTTTSVCNSLAGTTGHITTQTVQSNYHSPYQMQTNVGADVAPFKGATMSFNYQHVLGIHQLINDNANAANANAPSAKIVDQYLSEGYYRQNQFITNFNYRGSAKWSLSAYYVLNFDTKSDTAGVSSFPTIWNDIGADYGRASFDTKNQVFLFGSFNFPHLITLSPLMQARSGQPVNITTGQDNFNFLTYNTRPELYNSATMAAYSGYAKTFNGCGSFIDPVSAGIVTKGTIYTQVPANYCTGPASFTANLRISKTWGFGKKSSGPPQRGGGDQGGPGGPGGPGGGGPRGGGGGGGARGGGGGFGGGGGGGRGGASSGKKYNFVLGAQFQNLFNIADRATPNGTLSSSSFGKLTALAGGLYTTNDAVRRVQLTASFNF